MKKISSSIFKYRDPSTGEFTEFPLMAGGANTDALEQEIDELKESIANLDVPVKSVNGKTGAVVLNASDVGATTENYVDSKIQDLKNQGVQQVPLFVNDISECTDETKLYVLPDGYIYGFVKTYVEGGTVPNFTNVMDLSGAYIKDGYRYSHSGQAFKVQSSDCAIVIPVPSGKFVIRVRGAGNNATYNNYVYCDVNKDGIFELSNESWTRTVDSNGDIVINYNHSLTTSCYATFAVASGVDENNLIVTINEEITYTTTEGGYEYAWANTGRAFVPADYEDRIVDVENQSDDNARRISELEDEMNKPKPSGMVTMFISPDGNDENDGLTKNTPKKTVKACVESGATRISALRGVYNEEVSLSNIDTLEIFPTDNNYTNKDVHRYPPIVFDTSDTILVSSLSAYNSIKKFTYDKTNEALSYVFTNGYYSTVYSTTHGYYAVLWMITGNIKNDFKLKPVGTIAEVESTANSFTWVNNVIYLNADLTNVTEIRVPTSYNNLFTVSTANKVKLTDIEFNFAGRYNLFIENCPVVEIDNCATKYSSNGSGFDIKSANGVLRNCYASRVHDGYGIGGCGHTVFVDCTAEWCFDDGMSHHTKCTGTVIGGRFEGNVKAGNCPAYGATVNIYGGLYKDNGMRGIWYVTDSTHQPSTGMIQNTVMVGNDKGLMVDTSCEVIALNCKYVDNTTDKQNNGTLIEY